MDNNRKKLLLLSVLLLGCAATSLLPKVMHRNVAPIAYNLPAQAVPPKPVAYVRGAEAISPKPGKYVSGAPSESGEYAHQEEAKPALVNVNTASADELVSLPGIGPVIANRIIAQRSAQPFARVEDLLRVRGIGPAKLKKLRGRVCVE